MKPTFRDRIKDEILVCDGAMGTMLHALGVSLDRSLPELNLTDPTLVRTVHDGYIASGAQIIQTNTFGASRRRLEAHGVAEKTAEINAAGVRLAQDAVAAADRPILVAGSVGPVATGASRAGLAPADRLAALEEQVGILLDAGVDLLIFETFVDLAEMVEAVKVAKALGDPPIIAQMTFIEDGRTISGDTPEETARTLERLGVDVIGLNCSLGPQGVLRVLRQLSRHTRLPLSAMPNAGQAKMIGPGRFRYQMDEGYFAQQAIHHIELGAVVIGGCCGTTPRHTAAVVDSASGLVPVHQRETTGLVIVPPASEAPTTPTIGPRGITERLGRDEFVVAVEFIPAAGDDAEWVVEAAERSLMDGVDLIAIASSSTARAQISPISAAIMLQQRLPVEVIVSMTTWDKSIMALQADLLGAHSCGVRTVICRTGIPPLQGDYPNLDGIWDVDSIGLLRLLNGLNDGRDFNGMAIRASTSFSTGARVNPGAPDIDREIARAQRKVAAGARFLVTEPAYDLVPVRRIVDALSGSIPILLGARPLRDVAEAEYLRHEVPHVSIPAEVHERMKRAGVKASDVGLDICAELIAEARDLVAGLVITLEDPTIDLRRLLPDREPQAARLHAVPGAPGSSRAR